MPKKNKAGRKTHIPKITSQLPVSRIRPVRLLTPYY